MILIWDCYVLMLCAGCFTRLDPCAGGSELMLNVSLTDRRREAPTDCANLMLYRNQAKNILYGCLGVGACGTFQPSDMVF